MHGLLYQAKRKPNKNNIMEQGVTAYYGEKKVYVTRQMNGTWTDSNEKVYKEKDLTFWKR